LSATTNTMPASAPAAPTIINVSRVTPGCALTALAAAPVLAVASSSRVEGAGSGSIGIGSTAVGMASEMPHIFARRCIRLPNVWLQNSATDDEITLAPHAE
jgi:hypothetical protein